MYSGQLLIKLDESTLDDLKGLAEKLGLKISTFARMVLKNYIHKKSLLTKEDKKAIKIFQKHRQAKGDDFDEFVNVLFKDENRNNT